MPPNTFQRHRVNRVLGEHVYYVTDAAAQPNLYLTTRGLRALVYWNINTRTVRPTTLMELLLNTPPSTFALLRRALYYTPDLDGPLIAPWDEARLLDIEAMNRGFKKDQMLVSFKDDGEFVKDLVSLAVDLTNVDR